MNTGELANNDFSLTFRRQVKTIAYFFGPVLAIFVGIAFGLPDLFESTGVFRIEQSFGGNNRAEDRYAEYYVQTLASQVFTAESRAAWVKEFDLYSEKADWGDAEKSSELGKTLKTTIITTPLIDPIAGRERDVVTGFVVSYKNRSRIAAQKVAAAAAEAFLVENRRSRLARGQSEIDLFKKESEVYRARIAEVEERFAEFKERNSRSLPELMQVNMRSMDNVERDLETTKLQIDNLKRERVILQSQLSQIPSTSDEAIRQLAELQNEYVRVSSIYQATHPSVVSIRRQIDSLSETIDSAAAIPILRKQLEEISISLSEARKKYSDDHPDVRQLARSESALKDRIAALGAGSGIDGSNVPTNTLYVDLDTRVKAIDAQIEGLNGRLSELQQKLADYEEFLLQTPQVEREYQEFSRELANARQLYEETQKKQREAELSLGTTKGAGGEQLILAQAPSVPDSAAWPPRAAIIILGVILASGMGVGIATMREISSGTVRSSRDVVEFFGSPPIALIPVIRNRANVLKQRLYAVIFVVGVGALGSLAFFGAQSF